jgi:hypothetical protein
MGWVVAAAIGLIVILLVAVHSHFDQAEDVELRNSMPRWWRDAMGRWGGGLD